MSSMQDRRLPTGGRIATHNLLRLREAQRLTQHDLVARVRVSALDIRRCEHGQQQIHETLRAKLSEVFGVSVSHLMRWH